MHTCRSLLPDLELRTKKNVVFSELVSVFICLELRDVWDFVSSLFLLQNLNNTEYLYRGERLLLIVI